MKRVVISGFVLCFFVFLLISPAMGEDYVSKTFPSNEILTKAIGKDVQKIIGKYQNKDGRYEVFYRTTDNETAHVELIKLDTDIWIMTGRGQYKILQK